MSNEETKRKGEFDINRERTPGEMIIARRREMHLTQEELAGRSSISVSSLRRAEKNEVRTGLEIIEKLEKVLDIPLRKAFEDYWDSGEERKDIRPAVGGALKEFIREMVNRNLKEEELQGILEKVLSRTELLGSSTGDSGVGK